MNNEALIYENLDYHLYPELGEAIETPQKLYSAANPKGTKFVPSEMYQQMPALEQGNNVFCALVRGELAGYEAQLP